MKTIAMYLPQYHNVEENNIWWGEGYTDWMAMNCAKPLYEGHNQPKKPFIQYDLLEKKTLCWQAELMKKYAIDGLAIYHYWFKEGRQILEKPVANLLNWKEIDIPFCFYWANESWVRSWSAVQDQNVWAAKFEQEIPNDTGILLEQDYGKEPDWIKHFEYFLPFFKDCRYIKVNNRPLVMIYRPQSIPVLKEMLECWRRCAENSGFDGIYLISANNNEYTSQLFDAQLMQEPGAVIERQFPERFVNKNRTEVARYISYDDVWKNILNYQGGKPSTIFGGFTNYDDTPRRGNAGTVVFNGTAAKYKVYLTELMAKNAANNNELVFINAWNEWGEGMYMEPDEHEHYEYLEAVLYAKQHYRDEIYKYVNRRSECENDEILIAKRRIDRYYNESLVLSKLLRLREENRKLSIADEKKKVAIYGYGVLGYHLLNKLINDGIDVKYIIDQNANGINADIPAILPQNIDNSIDQIIVTNVHIFNDIKASLQEKFNGNIISIATILDEGL